MSSFRTNIKTNTQKFGHHPNHQDLIKVPKVFSTFGEVKSISGRSQAHTSQFKITVPVPPVVAPVAGSEAAAIDWCDDESGGGKYLSKMSGMFHLCACSSCLERAENKT